MSWRKDYILMQTQLKEESRMLIDLIQDEINRRK
jgi:hypothetical protein